MINVDATVVQLTIVPGSPVVYCRSIGLLFRCRFPWFSSIGSCFWVIKAEATVCGLLDYCNTSDQGWSYCSLIGYIQQSDNPKICCRPIKFASFGECFWVICIEAHSCNTLSDVNIITSQHAIKNKPTHTHPSPVRTREDRIDRYSQYRLTRTRKGIVLTMPWNLSKVWLQ